MDERGIGGDALRDLHALGATLAVDDFGTGCFLLLSLRRFPVSVLKVDRFCVAGFGQDDSDYAIVLSVIALAHSLGLQAVAGGVETVEQIEILREMGCDRAQGYLRA